MTEFAKSAPKMKLYYFNLPGKGEAIRLAAHYGKLQLEDVRITEEDFRLMKADGKLAFGQVPALELEDGTIICQSAAILRYVGRYAGLYPTEDFVQAAIIDSLMDEEIDLFTGVAVTRYKDRMGFGCLDKPTILTIREQLNDVILPRHLGFLETFLEKSSSGWLAGGDRPSIADFCFVPRLKWLRAPIHDGISTNILTSFPLIMQLMEKFDNLPEVVEYYQLHPGTKFD